MSHLNLTEDQTVLINFLVSGRRSYFDLFFPLIDEDLKNTDIYFYDLNTKLRWNINPKNTLFVSGYFGSDVLDLKFNESDSSAEESNESVNLDWDNATLTLRWNHLFSNKLFMNISGIYSQYNYGLTSSVEGSGGPANTNGAFDWKSKVENWILKPNLTLYQRFGRKLKFGANITLYKFSPAKVNSTEEGINNIDFKTKTGLEAAPYLEYEAEWKKVKLNAGLRTSWFSRFGPEDVTVYTDKSNPSEETIQGTQRFKRNEIIKQYLGLEPRIALNYSISDRKAVRLGYNRLFQYIHLISNTNAALPFDIWEISGTHIDPLEVNQLSIGYVLDTPKNDFTFSLETYYKSLKISLIIKKGQMSS